MPFLVFTLLTICYLAVLSRYFSIFFFNLVASSKRLNLAIFCCVPNMLRSKLLGKKIKEKRQISHLMISLSQDYISLISRSLLVAQEVRAYIAPQYVSMINYFNTIAILTKLDKLIQKVPNDVLETKSCWEPKNLPKRVNNLTTWKDVIGHTIWWVDVKDVEHNSGIETKWPLNSSSCSSKTWFGIVLFVLRHFSGVFYWHI